MRRNPKPPITPLQRRGAGRTTTIRPPPTKKFDSVAIPIIRVRNSVSKLEAPRDVLHHVDGMLAVEPPGSHWAREVRPGWDGKWHPIDILSGRFPTGLLSRVREIVPVATIEDERTKPDQRELDPYVLLAMHGEPSIERNGEQRLIPRDVQLAGIIGVLEHGRGIVGIATGGGKTEIALLLAAHVPGKCVIIVHRKDALHQTAERIRNRLDEQAALIGDGLWHDSTGDREKKFVVAMPQTIKLDPTRFRTEVADANVLVLDEIHRTSGAAAWYKIAQGIPAYYRIGITATPETGDPVKDLRLEAATGPILIRVRAGELADAGVLARCRVIYHRIDTVPESDDWIQIQRELIQDNRARNWKIVELTIAEAREGRRTLIICDTRRHLRKIAEILRGEDLRSTELHGGHSSYVRRAAKADLRTGAVEVVLATPVWDDSIDIPELDTVILAAGGKSSTRVIQRIGRALRKTKQKTTATVHDFFDTGHRAVRKHSVARQKACKREGFEIVKTEPGR